MPLDDQGREVPDQEPIVIRIRGQSIQQFDHIKAFIRRELSAAAESEGRETFDEANDFDIPDDDIRHSPHEYTEEQEQREKERFEDERAKAKKEFDAHVESEIKKRRPAARNEQGDAPAKRANGTTNRPKQFFLQEVPEDDQS